MPVFIPPDVQDAVANFTLCHRSVPLTTRVEALKEAERRVLTHLGEPGFDDMVWYVASRARCTFLEPGWIYAPDANVVVVQVYKIRDRLLSQTIH